MAFVREAIRRCLSDKPDVVWCNHLHLLPLALLLRLFRPGLRVAVNVYGMELWMQRQWLHRLTLPRASLVASDCHFSADYARERYAVNSERLHVLWDCVDIRRFAPRPRRQDLLHSFGVPVGQSYRYIMTLGRMDRLSQYKGYDRLIDAMAKLREHPEFVALFVGDGDDRPRMESRVRDEGLSRQVFFLGSVTESLLADTYNLCDVFCLVSDRGHGRGEGIPLTPLEAAACGKPILVGSEDGSQEAVVNGENGFILSPRDPDALPCALERLLLDDSLRKRLGQAARSRIEAEFSYEGYRDKCARCLEQLGVMNTQEVHIG